MLSAGSIRGASFASAGIRGPGRECRPEEVAFLRVGCGGDDAGDGIQGIPVPAFRFWIWFGLHRRCRGRWAGWGWGFSRTGRRELAAFKQTS